MINNERKQSVLPETNVNFIAAASLSLQSLELFSLGGYKHPSFPKCAHYFPTKVLKDGCLIASFIMQKNNWKCGYYRWNALHTHTLVSFQGNLVKSTHANMTEAIKR